ncbi:rab-protein geranylgeranyltransferase [Cubamyces lactineus]|nr:rab-protein geranylgeranyltransferase [Cubamyces lactineus]
MHGVKRVKYTREALAAKKEREQAKLKEYQSLTAEVLARRKARDTTQEAFDLTTKLLHINPEFYTIWNYRRNILTDAIFPQRTPPQINDLLADDLSLTTVLLKQHPKVYWIWNHRYWCLRQVPDGPTVSDPNGWRQTYWNKELFVVERMLDADPRNFHAWNYRRYVLEEMPVKRSEHAWHQRSKILSSMWATGKLNKTKSMEEEFDLVKNAMYTDPNDQSVWIYHRWLIGSGDNKDILEREIESIQELLDEQPDSKWCMESLVFYKRTLMRQHHSSLSDETRRQLEGECLELLKKLEKVDPDRRQRYIDLYPPKLAPVRMCNGISYLCHHMLSSRSRPTVAMMR